MDSCGVPFHTRLQHVLPEPLAPITADNLQVTSKGSILQYVFFHCPVLHHCKEWHLMWFKCTTLSKKIGPLRSTNMLSPRFFIELSPKPAATCLPGGKLQLTLDKIWHSLRTSFLPWLSGQDQTKTLRNQGFNTHWTTKTIHLQCLGPCWPRKQNWVSFTFRGSSPFFAPFTLKTIWCDKQKKTWRNLKLVGGWTNPFQKYDR